MSGITTQFLLLNCPQCGNRLAQNRPFGPPQVRCGSCDAIVKTNLPYWYDHFPVPGWTRFLAVLGEILNPSWLGIPGLMGIVIHLFVIYPLIAGFTMGLGLLYYPVFRVVQMITEMQTYKRTGEMPVWGKKVKAN